MSTHPRPRGPSFADTNGDGVFTLADATTGLGEAFFVPGDWAIWAIATYAPPVAQFLEIGATDYGGVLAGFLAALAWIGTAIAAGLGYQAIREADEQATAAIIRGFDEARRLYRVARRRAKFRHYSAAPTRGSAADGR